MSADLVSLLNPAAALAAGFVASLHCVGMCGPLSCALLAGGKGARRGTAHASYHAGRVIAYAALGALAAVVGGGVMTSLGQSPTRFAPWAFAAFFLILALGADRFVTRWQASLGVGRGVARAAYRVSGSWRGLALGLATPLIPCGPLYLMLWVATMSGSVLGGAMTMGAFALGTVPALALAQAGWSWLAVRRRPETLAWMRRGLSLAAVAAICARAFLDTSALVAVSGEGLCR